MSCPADADRRPHGPTAHRVEFTLARMVTLTIEAAADVDALELDAVTQDLRQRLLELDVRSAVPLRDAQAPTGARAGDTVMIGTLAVTLGTASLRAVVRLVQTWLTHRPVRRIVLKTGVDGDELTIEHPGRADQHKLVDAFIARNVRPG